VCHGAEAVAALSAAAYRYPGAWEDFPWGERVAKVRKKVFAFLGRDGSDDPSVSLKLLSSGHYALTLGCCEPTSHRLGRSGWVTIHLGHADCPQTDLLGEWLDESYRAVAPKNLVAQLDAGTKL